MIKKRKKKKKKMKEKTEKKEYSPTLECRFLLKLASRSDKT